MEAFVPMGVGAASRVVRVHCATRLIYHLPKTEVRSTKLPFLNRFNKIGAGIAEALAEKCVTLVEQPPPWLRALEPADRRPFLDELIKGAGAFIDHCGAAAFHGLVPVETAAAVVYDALRANDTSPVFIAPSGFHDSAAQGDVTVSYQSRDDATGGDEGAKGDALTKADIGGVSAAAHEAIDTISKRILQLATPQTVFVMRERLTRQYL